MRKKSNRISAIVLCLAILMSVFLTGCTEEQKNDAKYVVSSGWSSFCETLESVAHNAKSTVN